MDCRHFFSHTTAALIHGFPLPSQSRHSDLIHLSVVAPYRAIKLKGVVGHKLRIDQGSLIMKNGLTVPLPLEVWRELALLLPLDDLVAVTDFLVRRVAPFATPAELEHALATWTGSPGIHRLRQAFELSRPRTDSPMETHLRLLLGRSGLPEPEVNGAILDERGGFVAFGDLVYREARVVVEYDGDHHRTDRDQYNHDLDRLYEVEHLRWRIVRLTSAHIAGSGRVAVSRVTAALNRDATRGPVRSGKTCTLKPNGTPHL